MLRRRLRAPCPSLHAADLLAGERGAEDVVAHQLLVSRVHHRLVLDLAPQVAQHLHRALVGDVRARRVAPASGSG